MEIGNGPKLTISVNSGLRLLHYLYHTFFLDGSITGIKLVIPTSSSSIHTFDDFYGFLKKKDPWSLLFIQSFHAHQNMRVKDNSNSPQKP